MPKSSKETELPSIPRWAFFLAGGVVILAVILLVVALTHVSNSSDTKAKKSTKSSSVSPTVSAKPKSSTTTPTPTPTSTKVPSTTPPVKVTGPKAPLRVKGTITDARSTVLAQATTILREAAGYYKNSTVISRLQEGDVSALPASFRAQIQLTDTLTTNASIAATSYLSLIHLAGLVESGNAKLSGGEIAPLSTDAYKNVYVDMYAGSAFVPIGTYLGPRMGFSLEFVYLAGHWYLSPYSLVDEIYTVDIATNATSGAQTIPTPSPTK